MEKDTCNVCRKPIVNEGERIPRVYRVRVTGRILSPQYKHDACARAYEALATGLEPVS